MKAMKYVNKSSLSGYPNLRVIVWFSISPFLLATIIGFLGSSYYLLSDPVFTLKHTFFIQVFGLIWVAPAFFVGVICVLLKFEKKAVALLYTSLIGGLISMVWLPIVSLDLKEFKAIFNPEVIFGAPTILGALCSFIVGFFVFPKKRNKS